MVHNKINEQYTSNDDAKNIDADAIIHELSKLSLIQYDGVRIQKAKELNVKVTTLDKLVKNARSINNDDEDTLSPEIIPWDEPVDPEELFITIEETIRRFIVCEPETALAASLWIVMTWLMDVVHVAPLAIITAPEKRCGKTQLLSLIGKLSYRPISSSNISPAALFRAIDKWRPTLLIDEVDAFIRENDELRGLLNAGHTRDTAYTVRCVGEDHEPTHFNLWGAKALAGIGKLADTLMDRAIVLELRRKLPSEKVERLRHAQAEDFEILQRKLARFADDYREQIKVARPDLPDPLNDRAQDNWETLLAIADTAGADYGQTARETAVILSGSTENNHPLHVELLSDIYEVFTAKNVDRIFTCKLIESLCEDKEKRWATHNAPSKEPHITPRQLSKLLSNYSITSSNIRVDTTTNPSAGSTSEVKKGYHRHHFEDAFQRYLGHLPVPPEVAVTSATAS